MRKNGGFEWNVQETIILKIINWYIVKSVQGSTHPFFHAKQINSISLKAKGNRWD